MSSLDIQLSGFTQYVSNRFIMAGLIFWNWVSDKYNYVKGFLMKGLDGAIDAHRSRKWVFAQRNTVPWIVLEGKYENLNKPVFPLTYDPSSRTFTLKEDETGLMSRTHDHVVTAELINDGFSTSIDISYMFHTVSWKGDYHIAPSLYEVVMVECLSSGFAFTEESLSKLTLSVMTADAMIIKVPLSSNISKMPFSEWNNYVFELASPYSEMVSEAVSEAVNEVVNEVANEVVSEAVNEVANEVANEVVSEAVSEAVSQPETPEYIKKLMDWAKSIQEKGDAYRAASRDV
jgi:hypothetical protein